VLKGLLAILTLTFSAIAQDQNSAKNIRRLWSGKRRV
jgi:hypothetical protein